MSSDWVMDSDATHHITSDLNNLNFFYNYVGGDSLQIENGVGLPIQHIGSLSLSFSSHTIQLSNVQHIPTFSKNLISLSKLLLDNLNLILECSSTSCIFKNHHTKVMFLEVPSSNGLFFFNFAHLPSSPHAYFGSRVSADT
jgi:hypothetical protein